MDRVGADAVVDVDHRIVRLTGLSSSRTPMFLFRIFSFLFFDGKSDPSSCKLDDFTSLFKFGFLIFDHLNVLDLRLDGFIFQFDFSCSAKGLVSGFGGLAFNFDVEWMFEIPLIVIASR